MGRKMRGVWNVVFVAMSISEMTGNADSGFLAANSSRRLKSSDLQPNAIRFDLDVGTFVNDISDYTQRENAVVALREAINFLEERVSVVNPVQGDFVVDTHKDTCGGLLRDRTTK